MADITKALYKIDLNDGDLLVIKYSEGQEDEVGHAATEIAELLGEMGKQRCGVVFLPPGMELSALPESEMKELGWYKL
jgi:hypothetical protein